jgi:hypothetical protein
MVGAFTCPLRRKSYARPQRISARHEDAPPPGFGTGSIALVAYRIFAGSRRGGSDAGILAKGFDSVETIHPVKNFCHLV